MRVIVKTQIHGTFGAASSMDRYAYKEFDLPFAPFVGLAISHKTRKNETDDITINEVSWDNDKKCFVCYQESDKEIYNAVLHKETHRNISEIMDEYIEADWLFEAILAKAKKEG